MTESPTFHPHRHNEGDAQPLILVEALLQACRKEDIDEWKNCGGNDPSSKRHEVKRQHHVHQVLWKQLEQEEQADEDDTPYNWKLHSILHEASAI